MPRFVILEHDHPFLHWDLMLELGDVLRTWRLAAPPLPGQSIPATFLADHRRLYLEYEGALSGNRGSVVRWDTGTFSWQTNEDRHVALVMEGGKARGTAILRRGEGEEWTFTLIGK
jgi:hypothetical protein